MMGQFRVALGSIFFFFPSEGQIGLDTVSEEPDINQLTLNFKCCNLLKSINDRFLEIKLGYFKV